MSEKNKYKITFITNLKYLLKFSKVLMDERIEGFRRLQKRFLLYRDAHFQTLSSSISSSSSLKKTSLSITKKREIVYPLLILFDAENMPIQDHYRQIETMVIDKFGKKSWLGANLEAAYKESTEYYNNRGYNQFIRTHYVDYGTDKADDKLIEIARERKIPNIIIVTNDRVLIERLERVANKLNSGKLFIFNGQFFKEYTLSKEEERSLELRELNEKREKIIKEYNEIELLIISLENRPFEQLSSSTTTLKKIEPKTLISPKKIISTKESKNLNKANLDKHIRQDLKINPLFENFTNNLPQVNALTLEEAQEQAHKILKVFEELTKTRHLLETKGLDISVFKIALRYAINDFNVEKYNFIKLVDFIQHVVKGSNIKLALKEPSLYKLFLKTTLLNELEMSEVVEKKSFDIPDGILEDNFRATLDMDFLKKIKG